MSRIPRIKYMYYANFGVNTQALTMFPSLKNISGWQNGISFKIKGIDKPSVDLQVRELNQYNRKRYAYVKTEYKPVTITIYDTVDNAPFDLWIQYFAYYFGDVRLKSPTTMQSSPVDSVFDDSTGWGLRPLTEQISFFTTLDLYALYNKKYTKTSYLNPKISTIDWGAYESSDSSLAEIRMTLEYETLQYDSGDIDAGLAAQFGFDASQYLEPKDVQVPQIDLPTRSGLPGIPDLPQQPDSILTAPVGGVFNGFGFSGASYNAYVGGLVNNVLGGRFPQPLTALIPSGQFAFAASAGADTVLGSITGEVGASIGVVNGQLSIQSGGSIFATLANQTIDTPTAQLTVSASGQLVNASTGQALTGVLVNTAYGQSISTSSGHIISLANGKIYGVGQNLSNQSVGSSYGLAGLPGGQLPQTTAFITIPTTDLFQAVNLSGSSSLPGGGSYNFGSGQVPAAANSSGAITPYSPTAVGSASGAVSLDQAVGSALPVRAAGQRQPNLELGTRSQLNSNGNNAPQTYLTQPQQITAARKRVQLGTASLSNAVGNPEYTNKGIYTGFNQATYQPAPQPSIGVGLAESAANSGSTTAAFLSLNDPSVFGGSVSDNEPPPVVYPYDLV